jgi:beta-phosphoglucomutase family hydrolase
MTYNGTRFSGVGPMTSLAMVFDMDGVLVDSNPLHREAWEVYNLRHGIQTDESAHGRMYGRRNDEIVRDFFGDQLSEVDVAAHGAAKEAVYREMMAASLESALVPGVRQFLTRHAALPMAVATNAEPANVDFLLDRARLREFFRIAIDGHQVRHPKPHPEIYLRAADLLGFPPSDCVVFEDSEAGAAAGVAAGMRVVGVSTTHGELAGVRLMIRDFLDPALEPWLQEQEPAR